MHERAGTPAAGRRGRISPYIQTDGGERAPRPRATQRERWRRRATAAAVAALGALAAAGTGALAGAAPHSAHVASPDAPGDPSGHTPAAANATGGGAPAAAAPRLSRVEVPATGHQEATVAIDSFGRYSVRAASAQGSAVRVIDRMAGELGAAGEAGRENGRLDLFLDRGEYKLVVESHERGEGTAKLSVAPFVEARAGATGAAGEAAGAPELIEKKLVTANLDDLRQSSYWLRLPAAREVRLEAAGRYLADLRLWRDGSWLADVNPACAPIQPVTGRPLLRCEIAAVLPGGLYLVTAYGGAGQTWSDDSPEHPFYLRWGYPALPDAGRRRYVVSPFGEDWFSLPDNVNYVRIELPEAHPTHLVAEWAGPTELLPAVTTGDTADVAKESVPPVAEVHVSAKPADDTAAAGAESPRAARRRRHAAEPSIAEPAPSAGNAGAGSSAGAGEEGDEGDAAEAAAGGEAPDAAQPDAANGEAGGAGDTGAADTDAAPTQPPGGDTGGANVGNGAATDATMTGGEGDGEGGAGAAAAESAAPDTAPGGGRGENGGEAATGASGEGDNEGNGGADNQPGTAGAPAGAASAAPRRLWVAVQGVPGQVYVLQHFEQRTHYTIHQSGSYWIATVHSGDPRDSVDATAVLTSNGTGDRDRDRLEASSAIQLDADHAWARRFNLLEVLTVFVEVGAKGRYEVLAEGGGRFRLEPFATSRPPKYKAPPFVRSGAHWDLDPGLYVLSAQPQGKGGIVTVGLRPAGKFPHLLADAAAPSGGAWPVRGAARFMLPLDPERHYDLYTNRQPGVEQGLALRPWPIDLDQPLPVSQRPDEPLAVDFTTTAVGTLRAETEDGQLLAVSVDQGPWQTAAPVAPAGRHHAEVRNPAPAAGESGTARTVSYSLWVEPAALADNAPLPPLPAGALAALPSFPLLRPGAPHHLDLGRGETTTLRIQTDKPGLYELQTTGVLATAATLRTRTVTALARASANGVGRNALVRQYFQQGDVQATIATVGLSRGHLGITLTATEVLDGGELRLDAPARLTLAAGQAVAYRFAIAQAGEYRLLAMGLGFVYECRIEDADGWPVAPPNLQADVMRHFEPGKYRLILLPQPLASRAVTRLETPRPPLQFAGHGPHALPLDRAVEHLWREPEAAAAPTAAAKADTAGAAPAATAPSPSPSDNEPVRPPDRWRFTLPAAATAIVGLDGEMEGTVRRVAPATDAAAAEAAAATTAGDADLGRVPPGRALTVALAAGTYEVAVTCSRRNDRVRYHLRVSTAELVDGEERLVTAPVTLAVASGGGGLVELSSYAASDVRARLYDAGGALVADADDRPDDWNFLISERLPAGLYRLEIEPVGHPRAQLRVAMRTVAEVADPPLTLPWNGDVAAGDQVHLLPLQLSGKADLLLVAARSDDNLGLTLERRLPAGWQAVGSATGHDPRIELPLPAAGAGGAPEYRVRLGSLDRRGNRIRLAVAAAAVPHTGESRLAKGLDLAPLAGLKPPLAPLAATVIDLKAPGLLRLRIEGGAGGHATAGEPAADSPATGPGATVFRGGSVAGAALPPLAALGTGDVLAGIDGQGSHVWVVAAEPHGAVHLRGERLAVPAGLAGGVALTLPAPDAVVEAGVAGRGGDRASGPLLVVAEAHAGQPAVAVGERGAAWSRTAAAAGMSLGDRRAVTVALAPHEPVLRAWSGAARLDGLGGSGGGAGTEPAAAVAELRLTQQSYAVPQPESAGWGVGGASLAGLAARRFDLPPGHKEVRLSLGAGLVAVLSQDDRVTSVHWQGGQPFEELLDSDATRLTVLHTRDGHDPFAFELLPAVAGDADLALSAAAPFSRSFDHAGTLRLRLPAAGDAAAPALYRVWSGTGLPGDAAAVDLALLDGAGGAYQGAGRASRAGSGETAEIAGGAGGGVLLIRHGPGTIVAWQTAATGALWQAPLDAPAQAVTPPAAAPLDGRFTHFTLDLRQPAVLHVRSTSPALTLLRRAGDAAGTAPGGSGGAASPDTTAETVAMHPAGVRLDAYLPAGVSHVGLAAVGSGVLAGTAEVTTTPVTAIGDGLGAETLLPAGDTHYFSFHVDSRRAIGWGAAAGAERVSCRVLRGDGQPLPATAAAAGLASIAAPGGTGAAAGAAALAHALPHLRPAVGGPDAVDAALAPPPRPQDLVDVAELDAGDYLLAISAPADAPPVRVRPVVVGLALPDTGPPPEVIRQYLQQAGAVVEAPSGSHP